MAMTYFFGLLIENKPSLLFKIKGFDLHHIVEEYNDVNHKIKKMVPEIIIGQNKNTANEKKSKINEKSLENAFKETLNSLNFDKIPSGREILDLILKNENNLLKGGIKNVLDTLTYFRSQTLIRNNKNNEFNLNEFIANLNGVLDYENLNEYNNSFNNNYNNHDNYDNEYKYNIKNYNKVRILMDKNYNLKSITGFSHDYKTNFLFFEFFENVPWQTIVNYDYKIQFTYIIYQFSLNLIEKIALIPELLEKDNKYLIRWIPSFFIEEIKDIFKKLSKICPKNLMLFNNKTICSDEQLKIIISLFINNIMEKANFRLDNLPYNLKLSSNIYELFFTLKLTEVSKEELNPVNIWISKLHSFEKESSLSLSISNKNNYDFNLLLDLDIETTSELKINHKNRQSNKEKNNDKNISVNDLTNSKNSTSKDFSTNTNHSNENQMYSYKLSFKEKIQQLDDRIKFKLFHEIYILEKYIPQIKDLINNKGVINLNNAEFADFYQNIVPILNILNFKVDIPKNLSCAVKPKIVTNLKLKSPTIDAKNLLNLENLVDFDWKIAIGDKTITIGEFKKFMKLSSQFINIDNETYLINPKDIHKVYEKINKIHKKFKNNQLLQIALSSSYENNDVNIDENILKLLNQVKYYKDIKIPYNLNGTLRPYQYKGFSWLVQNISTGFGSILADDMGLGKTLQVLTSILHFKNEGFLENKKVLIIAPTAILFNWEKEIEHFTPSLTFNIFHSGNCSINSKVDITITSYGMVRNNLESFNEVEWFMTIADEAQNIKNPNTKQSKAIKKIKSENNIALTGTPVENCLIDYWSIFDFTNKSYLDGVKNFKQNYVNPIEKNNDETILNRFKAITSPFILRRMKTDKNIIDDLPDKIITECYCPLSKIQAALYEDTINKTLKKIEKSHGIERKGMVFKLINSLKQICNHPSHFTTSDQFGIEESGKMEMLIDILENVLENEKNKEKAIIFTQFVKMGNIIIELLKDKFKIDVMFYHGGLTRKVRDQMVEEFQNNKNKQILIVSLKAGGTGLNLTAANHVIHFDLWWNPAVENQATDRVFRIGQTNKVFVYRFITNGTFEEKINQMLMNKKQLAEITIGTGEKFITEMSNEELEELISLI